MRGGRSRAGRGAGGALPAVWAPRAREDPRSALRRESASAGRVVRARTARGGFGGAVVHQGKELSFTNLLDLDAAARIALEFDEPAAVVIKHTNPCGVATGGDAGRGVRARARRRRALGVWRHRRTQSADRSRDGARADVHVHRGGDRAGDRRRRRRARGPGGEAEPARGHRVVRRARRRARRAIDSRRLARAGAGSRDRGRRRPWPGARRCRAS